MKTFLICIVSTIFQLFWGTVENIGVDVFSSQHRIITNIPLLTPPHPPLFLVLYFHWPEDTKVEEGVWRDYYSGEKLDDFEKPWKKSHDKLYGESKNWVGLYTWWPKHGHVVQFNSSWWEIPCSSPWRGCPCKNDQLPPILRLRGLCPFSTMRTKFPTIGTRFTPVQRPDNLRNDWFKGGLSSKIELEGENPDNPSTERMKWLAVLTANSPAMTGNVSRWRKGNLFL